MDVWEYNIILPYLYFKDKPSVMAVLPPELKKVSIKSVHKTPVLMGRMDTLGSALIDLLDMKLDFSHWRLVHRSPEVVLLRVSCLGRLYRSQVSSMSCALYWKSSENYWLNKIQLVMIYFAFVLRCDLHCEVWNSYLLIESQTMLPSWIEGLRHCCSANHQPRGSPQGTGNGRKATL